MANKWLLLLLLLVGLCGRNGEVHSSQVPPVHSPNNNSTVHKCRCEGQQVLREYRCHDNDTSVVVQDPATGKVQVIATSQFGHVEVGLPQCPSGHLQATLDPGHGSHDQFSLVASGALLWQQRQYDQYCIEHTWDAELQQLSWQAKLCLAPPQVPRCCVDGSCSGTDARLFSPPVRVDEVKEHWQSEAVEQVVDVTCDPEQELLMVPLDDRRTWLSYEAGNATLVHQFPLQQRHIISHNYCVATHTETSDYLVQFCYKEPQIECEAAVCIRKCCPANQLIHGSGCVVPENDSLLLRASDLQPGMVGLYNPADNVQIEYGYPQCPHFYPLQPHLDKKDTFVKLPNGTLHLPEIGDIFSTTHYCIEHFQNPEGEIHIQALVCFAEGAVKEGCQMMKSWVYPVLLLVSCVFLAITMFIYFCLADWHRLHSRLLISLVSALLTGYLLMASSSLAAGSINSGVCTAIALVMHFSLLAAFFWLNVMSFDIWRALRKMRVASDSKNRRRFLLYSAYAWGCPLLVVVVAAIMEYLPDTVSNTIRPNYSSEYCWIQTRRSMWAYFYGLVLVLVVANCVFFCLVARIICRSHNNNVLRKNRAANRDRLWLYVKLFLVMGVTWLAEVVSFQSGGCNAWYLTDIINALQGFFIFLVFVCQSNTRQKVRQTRCCVLCLGPVAPEAEDNTMVSRASSYKTEKRASNYGPNTMGETEVEEPLHSTGRQRPGSRGAPM